MADGGGRLHRETMMDFAVDGTAQKCEVVTEFARLEELSAEWDHVWTTSSRPEIFQNFGWIRAFWRAYGYDRSLFSPVVFQGDKVVGILPIVLHGRTLQFLGVPGSDYNDILCEESRVVDILRTVLEALLDRRGAWKNCILENLSGRSRIVRHLQELPRHLRRHLTLVFRCSCPAIVLGEKPTGPLSHLLRKKSLRRHLNRFQKLGQINFRHLENRAEIRPHLTRFFRLHVERWAMTGRVSHFQQPETRRFYEALVDELDPSRELRFGVLELDSQPIAYHFGFEFDGKFIWYQSAFDVSYWEYSPGEVLLGELLRYAREKALCEFDFTIGGEVYKNRYATQSRENFAVYLDGHLNPIRSSLNFAMRLGQEGFRRTKQNLERRPRARRAIKQNALRVSAFLGRVSRLFKQDGPFVLGLRAVPLIRNGLWARDELLFFFRVKQMSGNETEASTGRKSGLLIARGTLGDLAVLSLENSGLLDRTELDEYRRRLRQGDQVYIGRQGETLAVVAWLGTCLETAAFKICARCTIPSDSSALLIYDCRTRANAHENGLYAEALAALAREATAQRAGVFIHSSILNGAARTNIEEAGFRMKYLVVHLRALHWFHRHWVSRVEESPPRP